MTNLLQDLQTGTKEILEFLKTVDDEKSHKKKPLDDWSILDCMEHVFITEKGIYKLLNRPDLFSDKPSTKHEKIEEYTTGKFKAPDYTLPAGRFSSIEEIGNAFKILRNQLEEYIVNELPKAGDETYPHPILGPITKPQWIEFAIEHGQRHLLQMKKRGV